MKTYTVIYRTGGTLNAKWHRTLGRFTDYKKAVASANEIERQGYKALIQDTKMLDAIGLPEGWEAN